MFKFGEIAFGDNVAIVDTEATRRTGHANLRGMCVGMTTPSVTGVDVIGNPVGDVALNVHFEAEDLDAWFEPALLKLVDHPAGMRASVGDHSFVKGPDGEWIAETPRNEPNARRRRWFKR